MDRRAVLRNAASRRGAWRASAATGVSHVLSDPRGRVLTSCDGLAVALGAGVPRVSGKRAEVSTRLKSQETLTN